MNTKPTDLNRPIIDRSILGIDRFGWHCELSECSESAATMANLSLFYHQNVGIYHSAQGGSTFARLPLPAIVTDGPRP
jgi:hypothetical protein